MRADRLSYRAMVILAAFLLLTVLAGCGGGGSDSSLPPIDSQLFTPNYISDLSGLYHWDNLPVRVSFTLTSDWLTRFAANPDVHLDAADQWNQDGLQALVVVVNPGQEDVPVTFVNQSVLGGNSLGKTTFSYDASTWEMVSAEIQVALNRPGSSTSLSANDIQSIVAHEIGHAIGIHGHSDMASDLMYSSHTYGTLKLATQRDLNTAMTAYPSFFGKSIPSDRGTRAAPDIRTVVIE